MKLFDCPEIEKGDFIVHLTDKDVLFSELCKEHKVVSRKIYYSVMRKMIPVGYREKERSYMAIVFDNGLEISKVSSGTFNKFKVPIQRILTRNI